MQAEQASFLLSVLATQLKNEHKTTVKVVEAMPADRLSYQPDPRSMNALDLAFHIAGSECFFMEGAVKGEFPEYGKRPEALNTPAAVSKWYQEQFQQWVERVEKMTAEELLREVPFHGWNPTALTCLQIMLSHSIHHRGQLSAYLRPMGGKVPSIYGSSADDKVSEAAAG